MDAWGQADLVRRGEVTPSELVDAAIARIEAVDPALNAVIHRRFDAARAEAAGPLPDGPLRGVPFLVKDLDLHIAGEPLHCGTRFLADAGSTSATDDTLTERFRAAGLVILGRTNTPEFGTTITTEPVAAGPTRNPWNTEHSTGGSSGGSGAAVASMMVPAAHASDGGGSIRIPASECGLVGLKPTRGRTPLGPRYAEHWNGAVINGVVTRSVRDTALFLDVMSGPAPGDPFVTPPPARPYVQQVGADPGIVRIGLLDRPAQSDVVADPVVGETLRAVGGLLENLGHRVEASHPEAMGDPDFSRHFITIMAANLRADLDEWETTLGRTIGGDELEPANAMFAAIGGATSAADHLAATRWQHRWARRMAEWWDGGFDLLCCPVINGTPPPLGWLSDPEKGLDRVTELMQYTAQFNVTGQPAISLPLAWTDDGLPIGIQLVAAFGREDLLVRVASELQGAQDWTLRLPPVHA
nr:amidase family protein [Rhabdothermincola salaria]